MKFNIRIFLCFTLCVLTIDGISQIDIAKLGAIDRGGSYLPTAEIERIYRSKSGIQFGISPVSLIRQKVKGFELTAGYRYYFEKLKKGNGFFLGLNTIYGKGVNGTSKNTETNFGGFGINAGKRTMISKLLQLEFFGNYGWEANISSRNSLSSELYSFQPYYKIGVSIGIYKVKNSCCCN